MRRGITILILAMLASPAAAGDSGFAELALEAGEQVSIATAIDGQTLRLSDGRELRLASIDAPVPLSPRIGVRERADPALTALVNAAHEALTEIAAGQDAILRYEHQRSDRYGRLVAHVETASGTWVQSELLARGMARVHATPDSAAAASVLLQIEAAARQARRGLWVHSAFRVRRPEELGRWLDSFQIVEGQIADIRQTRARTWIDFEGEHGKTLVLSVATTARTGFRAVKFDLATLRGARVRTRGWIQWLDGPLIEIDHPAQIEVLP